NEVCRFVAAARRSRRDRARQEERCIGLDQQSIIGNPCGERCQLEPATLVADPAGDTDVAVEIEIRIERTGVAGEALHDRIGQSRAMSCEMFGRSAGRVAVVDENRQADSRSEIQLRVEYAPLYVARRVVAVEVETAFADRPYAGGVAQSLDGAQPTV